MTSSPVTLITGGTSGIGAEIVSQLLDAGHTVVATGRDAGRCDALRATYSSVGDRLLVVQGDASEWEDVQALVATTKSTFGRIDTVIPNAGFSSRDNVEVGDPEVWKSMVLTNVLGPAMLVKATLDDVKATKGHYVFIGSVAGVKNFPGNVYSATKWAITGFAENTRMMVTEFGVRVTLIAPGMIDTPFWGGKSPEYAIPPKSVADAVTFALSQPEKVDINTIVIRPVTQPV